ncbi:phosphopantetheine-binding protein [Nocardia sp. NPDC003482]
MSDPSTPSESTPPADIIAESWRKTLGVADVGDDDDFFELGGDSIMVTRIVSFLRRELGVEVDMLQVWDTPIFGEFREAVEQLLSQETVG